MKGFYIQKIGVVCLCLATITMTGSTFFISGCSTTKKRAEIESKAAAPETQSEAVSITKKNERDAELLKNEQEKKRLEKEKAQQAEEVARRLFEERKLADEEARRIEEERLLITEAKALPQGPKSDIAEIKASKDIYFMYDLSKITDQAAIVLQEVAAWLLKDKEAYILVEGHCDERGTTEYNLALGERRALAAKQYLMSLGILGSRISTISYGEEMPAYQEHNETAWAKNRRAHISMLRK